MRSSQLVAVLAIVLMLGFVLPMLCFAFVASGTTAGNANMPSGCHGQEHPMPMPSHSCCYASHQVPQAVPIATTPAPESQVFGVIDISAGPQSHYAAVATVEPLDSSPPSSAVLRI
jgi:hypothetical protein